MPSFYQVALINSITIFENVLDNKQTADAIGGDIATDLQTAQINESTTVLNADAAVIQDAATAGGADGWTTSDSNTFNVDNSIYQTDSSVSQTGQNNASSAVQALQSQVSQDGTNISNAISIANVLVQIGQYTTSLLRQGYTS